MITFKENQNFTQWWLWLILIGLPLTSTYAVSKQFTLTGEATVNTDLIIMAFVSFSLIVLFVVMRLKTEITQNEIHMNFFPFVNRKVKWNEIKNVKIVDYGFVGYGIRFGSKYGTVFNTGGKFGLAIEQKNGKKFVIGTQKKGELSNIIKFFQKS